HLILDDIDAAHLERRRAARIFRPHPRLDLFVDDDLERGTDLIVEIAFDRPPMDEILPEARHAERHRHSSPSGLERASDRERDAVPLRRLLAELAAAGGRETVVLRA